MKKVSKVIFSILGILAIGVGLFCLVGYLYGLATSQNFVEIMHVWLPFLTQK